MAKTPMRPVYDGAYPGTNVTPDTNSGPGLAPQVLVAPTLASAPTFSNLPQRLVGNPTTGEVSFPTKWKTDRNLRRRSSWRANTLTADFRADGAEGAIAFAGTGIPPAATTQLATIPRVRLTTNIAIGNSKTSATSLGLFRWRWDPSAGLWIGTVTYINARYWIAMTSVTLDQIAPGGLAALGAGNRVVAWCLDGQTFGNLNWRAITWDGAAEVTTDTGINASGSANTMFMPSFEVDTDASKARFLLYDRGLGTDYGVKAEHTFTTAVGDVFGLEAVVQVTAGAAALSLDVSEFFCEHAP